MDRKAGELAPLVQAGHARRAAAQSVVDDGIGGRRECLPDESLNVTESTLAERANLKTALRNLEELLRTQGELLTEQRNAWEEQREISARQSQLLGTYAARSKRLTLSLIIAVPAAAGLGLLAGILLAR